MCGRPIQGPPVVSSIVLIGQAPGPHEADLGRPFAWLAGRTLFSWFADLGVDEEAFRARVFIAAVCRCFPGKAAGGGDRVPSRAEVNACRPWLQAEFELLRPRLVIPVGRLAIAAVLPPAPRLADVIGRRQRSSLFGAEADVIALPHPSGASTWHKRGEGRELLGEALSLIAAHPAWRQTLAPTVGPGEAG